jgi:hypothetical protein
MASGPEEQLTVDRTPWFRIHSGAFEFFSFREQKFRKELIGFFVIVSISVGLSVSMRNLSSSEWIFVTVDLGELS